MVGPESEAHHVDWLRTDMLHVPCRVNLQAKLVMQIVADAFDGDGQITLAPANQENVIHVEEHVRYEPPSGDFACPAVHSLLGKMLFAIVVCVAQVIVSEPLAQIRADIQSVIARVLVDEVERQVEQPLISHVAGQQAFQHFTAYRWIAFAHVQFHEHSAGRFAHPLFDRASSVGYAPAGDARGLPSADLRAEQRHQGGAADVIIDLMADALASDDAYLPAYRLHATKVADWRE